MIILLDQPTFFLNKDNPTKISYNKEDDDDNWKSIIVGTYLHGFPMLKEDEILYKYSDSRGYISKSYEFNKRYTDGDIDYEFTKLGNNTLLGIYYCGDNEPVKKIDSFIRKIVSNKNYTEYIDMNMDNPWVRIIVMGEESKFLFTK
jgi:hypothetical protein